MNTNNSGTPLVTGAALSGLTTGRGPGGLDLSVIGLDSQIGAPPQLTKNRSEKATVARRPGPPTVPKTSIMCLLHRLGRNFAGFGVRSLDPALELTRKLLPRKLRRYGLTHHFDGSETRISQDAGTFAIDEGRVASHGAEAIEIFQKSAPAQPRTAESRLSLPAVRRFYMSRYRTALERCAGNWSA